MEDLTISAPRKNSKNLRWDLFQILSLSFIRQVDGKPCWCSWRLSTAFRKPHKGLCVPLIRILPVASAGIYLDRVVRVESQFLAHLTIQPPLSLESTGRKITNSIFIITKASTAGDNKVVSYGGFELLQLSCLKPPIQGSVRFGITLEQSIVRDWLYSIKLDGRIFFLFPLGNTSSKTCKISMPPSGMSLEQNKGTSWRKEKLLFLGVFRLLLPERTVYPHMSSTEFKELC